MIKFESARVLVEGKHDGVKSWTRMQSKKDNVLPGGGQGERRSQIVVSPVPHDLSSPVPSCEPWH
jgi:hypothetical protein